MAKIRYTGINLHEIKKWQQAYAYDTVQMLIGESYWLHEIF